MFEVFKTVYFPDPDTSRDIAPVADVSQIDNKVSELFICHGGESFNNGIYRIIPFDKMRYWNNLVSSVFPNHRSRILCFAVDWLGRVFAVDLARNEDGFPGVLLLEPGTAEALEIPCNIESFHDSELIEYQEEALAASFYQEWLKCGGKPPAFDQCIGYKTPLYLGGSDTLDNLAVSDLDVYWTIAGQLIQKIRG